MGIVMAACESRNCDYQIIDEYTAHFVADPPCFSKETKGEQL